MRRPLTSTAFGQGMTEIGTGEAAGTGMAMVPRLRGVSEPASLVGTVRAETVEPSARMTKPVVAPSVQWRIG